MASYAHPEVLVDTAWVEEHLDDAAVRIVEVDVDTRSYADEGHLPGAVGWDWSKELCDTRTRDIVPKGAFELLLSRSGIANDTTIVLYGDNNNWFACWALWQLKIYGHADVRLMNGGRNKWIAEGRPLSDEPPAHAPTVYRAREADFTERAFLKDVMLASNGSVSLVDVRSPAEYSGEILAPPGLPETCQRGGHVPSAQSVPWDETCAADGTFKQNDELIQLYAARGVTVDKPAIAYCRIGERSSHTWFVLKYLLGLPHVQNYDGSWTEWGNLVAAPIEK